MYTKGRIMNTPHKHAELIKQWADGKEIEDYYSGRWSLSNNPSWNDAIMYRVKAESIVQWFVINNDGYATDTYLHKSNALKVAKHNGYKLVRLEIDPTTFTATCALEDV